MFKEPNIKIDYTKKYFCFHRKALNMKVQLPNISISTLEYNSTIPKQHAYSVQLEK